MKVLIATPLYPPEIGGPATYVQMVEDGLRQRGFEVAVSPFAYVRRYSKLLRHLKYTCMLFREGKDADVIFALDTISVGVPALIVAKLRRKQLVLRLGGLGSWERATEIGLSVGAPHEFRDQQMRMPLRIRLLASLERYVLRHACIVIAQGSYQAGVLQQWGVKITRIRIVYNGMDQIPGMDPSSRRTHHIVSAGRLVELKQFEIVIDAVARLRKQIPEVTFTIYGDGPSRARLAMQIDSLGLRDVVQLHAPIDRNALLREISSATVLVLASRHETFPNLIVESMAVGTPVIATNVGGIPEIVSDGVNGLLVPSGDSSALANALVRVLHDADYRTKLATNAKKSLDRFNTDTVFQNTFDALTEAVHSSDI